MTFLKLLRVFGSRPEHIPVFPFLHTSKQKLDHTTNTAVLSQIRTILSVKIINYHITRGFCIVHEQTQCPPMRD